MANNKIDLSSINGLMKKMANIQKGMSEAEQRLASTKFNGAAGGGEGGDEDTRCEVVGNGKYEISTLVLGAKYAKIMGSEEALLLADLVRAAVNDYCRKVQVGSSANLAGMASEMGLPMDLLDKSGLLGKN